jgi:enamine deaminase RidA (YjgF/YER057c/UK114 family)
MEYSFHRSENPPAVVQVSHFRGAGGASDYHLLVRPIVHGTMDTQLDCVAQAYQGALAACGLGPGTALLRRFFCSDLTNQSPALSGRALTSRESPDEPCAVSWVNQPPAPPAKVALWAYHVADPTGLLQKRLEGPTLTWTRDGLDHFWTTGIVCPTAGTPEQQTRGVFQQYADLLRTRGLSLANDVIRTWLFVRNITANYEAVVTARREFFREHGLTADTHFIASTGIEGAGADPCADVVLDAHAVAGLRPGQIRFLAAPDHLGPTHVYGVTFERGTTVAYRDRTQVIISGTASIDPQGRILHAGDVSRQLDRAVENVEALLRQAGATLEDLGVLIAYVRDPADQALVCDRLRQRCGNVPIEVVVAAVCRTGWLVEIEGLATTGAGAG